MKKAILLICCIVVTICLAACGTFPARPVGETPANKTGSADISPIPAVTLRPIQTPDIKAGTIAACKEWNALYDDENTVMQSDPIGPYTLSLSYDDTAQGYDPVTGAAVQGATLVSVNGGVVCCCEWGTEVTAAAYDLTNDGTEELLLVLCPIMDNGARCDVHVFSLDEASGKAMETLTVAGSPSSAFVNRNAKSYLHIPDNFTYPVNGVTTSGVNGFCTDADIMETGDGRYLRISHGVYQGGHDYIGFAAYSYVMWDEGWKVFNQDITLN